MINCVRAYQRQKLTQTERQRHIQQIVGEAMVFRYQSTARTTFFSLVTSPEAAAFQRGAVVYIYIFIDHHGCARPLRTYKAQNLAPDWAVMTGV